MQLEEVASITAKAARSLPKAYRLGVKTPGKKAELKPTDKEVVKGNTKKAVSLMTVKYSMT